MPIYPYRCSSCGFQKDHLQKLSEPLLTVCPQCGADAYRKLLTAAGFQLKGSGWYATDFKGGANKPAADGKDGGAEKPAADKSSDKSGDKSLDKSADKPAEKPAAAPAVTPAASAPAASGSSG